MLFGNGFSFMKTKNKHKGEVEFLKGMACFVMRKQFLTVVIAEGDWEDEQGVPYGFQFVNGTLFWKRVAIGFNYYKKKRNLLSEDDKNNKE